MSIVTDAPTVHDWPILAHGHQKFGHFVLLRLDALATVAILDDDEVSGAAAHLPQDWFLGIVLKAANLGRVNDGGRPLLDLDIYLVGVGPPEPLSAAIPISPAPQISDGHPPIQVPFELPWPNLYAHSYLNIVAVITCIHAGPSYFPDPLTDEQQRALLQMASKDQYHRHDAAFEELLKKAAEEQPAGSAIEGSGTESDCESGSGSYDDFMLSDDAQLITAKYQSRRLCVELWLDPASCPGQPAPPSALVKVGERLELIMKEWCDRTLEEAKSRRPQLIKEWTQRVSEAASGLDGQIIHARDPVLDDDDILPEDAVDSRAEQRAHEEDVLNQPPVFPMQPHSTSAMHEDGVTSFESTRCDQHAHDDTSLPSPSAPPAADVRESAKSSGTVASRRMSTVMDSPTRHDWPVLAQGRQRFGHFVLLRVDSLASVAILDDDEASRAAVHLPQDWFLGIVTSTAALEQLDERGRQPLNLHIHLVGVGPSEPVSAAIPLSPAPQINDDHPPIQVPFALPWPNLYAHSYLTLSAVVTRIHAGPNYFPGPLGDEQLGALLEMASKDRYHRHDATFEALMKKLAEEQPDGAGSDCGSDSGSDDDFMLSDEAQLITATYQRRHLCVELWLDPASCPGQPAPPSACTDVVRRLKEIMKGWYDRKLEAAKSRRPQLIKEWTQRVKEAAAGLEEQLVRARDSVLSDDDVLPEDAVDYRAERRAHEEDILNKPVPPMQPQSPAATHEVGIIDIENARRDRHRHDSTSVPSPATPFPADVKASPKSPGTVASRLVSTKQIASKWLRSHA